MAKDNKQTAKVELRQNLVDVVDAATFAHGSSSFLRVNIPYQLNDEEFKQLEDKYSKEGYEVFANSKSVLLLKQ